MKTILETIKKPVAEIGHGESFWIDDEWRTHVRLSVDDPHLRVTEGHVYSVCRGVIYEHDWNEEVYYVKITHQE